MDGDGSSINDVHSGDPDAESSKIDLSVEISSTGETGGEFGNASEVLSSIVLNLAYAQEKLLNLNVFMMRLATMESDFENIDAENGKVLVDSMESALQFDLLSGILDSEVLDLHNFITELHTDIIEAGTMISSYAHLGENFIGMKEKLRDSEESLKQSQEQVSEIRTQSTKFQRTLACFTGQENQGEEEGPNFSESQLPNINPKINMQTAEQQKQFLRMLEKSLAREMDLEKKLTDSRKTEEELKRQLLTLEQESFFIEEEAIDACGSKFEAENAAVVLMGISKELLGRLQILQFSLNGSAQRETELRSKLEKSAEQLEAKDGELKKLNGNRDEVNDLLISQIDWLKTALKEAEERLLLANSKVFTLTEKITELDSQLKESEFQQLNAKVPTDESSEIHDTLLSEVTDLKSTVDDLKEKLDSAESRAEIYKAKCKSFEEAKAKLHEEFARLKTEKVDLLERQLEESNITLQHAVASAEASQEKQILLNSTILDMESLIENLKSKLLRAESQADSMEDKCIILSEENARLKEELSFLRDSLNHAEETRIATAKDIGLRTKMITELVMQLAMERERLHKQISSLTHENKTLVVKLHQVTKKPEDTNLPNRNGESVVHSKGDVTEVLATGSQVDKPSKTTTFADTKLVDAHNQSELESVRRIDVSRLNFKHILTALLIVFISAAIYIFYPDNLGS